MHAKSKQTKLIILLLTFLIIFTLLIFILATRGRFPDSIGYLNMALGLIDGNFSSWYFLEKIYPETLRMPGYPIFIGFLINIFKSELSIQITQYLLLLISYALSCKIILNKLPEHFARTAVIIFLTISLFSIQLPYYSGLIAPQSLASFFMVLYFYVSTLNIKSNLIFGVMAGVILCIIFQLLPVILFLPLLILLVAFFCKISSKRHVISLIVFSVGLIPFGLWNYNNHGVFKVTSIEGGAGVAHMGYWQYKLPKNYTEKYYWGNNTGDDILYPFRGSDPEAAENLKKFVLEWEYIQSIIIKLKTEEDLIWERKMNQKIPGQSLIHNSEYTLAREKELWELTFKNIINEPVYYLKRYIYAFFRSYFTGLSELAIKNANNPSQIFKVFYPFLVTFIFVFLGLLYISFKSAIIWRQLDGNLKIMLAIIFYFGAIHAPFATQARYTVPIHLLIFILVAIYSAPLIGPIKKLNN